MIKVQGDTGVLLAFVSLIGHFWASCLVSMPSVKPLGHLIFVATHLDMLVAFPLLLLSRILPFSPTLLFPFYFSIIFHYTECTQTLRLLSMHVPAFSYGALSQHQCGTHSPVTTSYNHRPRVAKHSKSWQNQCSRHLELSSSTWRVQSKDLLHYTRRLLGQRLPDNIFLSLLYAEPQWHLRETIVRCNEDAMRYDAVRTPSF
jgi:hypothetical protein